MDGSWADPGHLALDELDIAVILDLGVEVLQAVGGADIDEENNYLGLGILLTDVGGLLQGSQAADAGAEPQVILVAGTRHTG